MTGIGPRGNETRLDVWRISLKPEGQFGLQVNFSKLSLARVPRLSRNFTSNESRLSPKFLISSLLYNYKHTTNLQRFC
jgi:hypothetical protein